MAQDRERDRREDLKAREYRDKQGRIHHHTHTYIEKHGNNDGARREARDGRGDGGAAHATTDHDEIRTWAEGRGGRPAAVTRTHTGGDVGIVRIMFPDAPNSEHDALTEISWDEFFAEFEDRNLALLYDPHSLFSKIIGRDTAEKRARGDHKAAR